MAPGSRGARAVFVCFSGEDSGQTGNATCEPRVARRSRSRYLSNTPGLAGQLAASRKDNPGSGCLFLRANTRENPGGKNRVMTVAPSLFGVSWNKERRIKNK
jgi:hypothetical protein